jgi:hypothetical protein
MNALTKTSWSVSDTFLVRRIHADRFEGEELGGPAVGLRFCRKVDPTNLCGEPYLPSSYRTGKAGLADGFQYSVALAEKSHALNL